jgi:hypothetical protein
MGARVAELRQRRVRKHIDLPRPAKVMDSNLTTLLRRASLAGQRDVADLRRHTPGVARPRRVGCRETGGMLRPRERRHRCGIVRSRGSAVSLTAAGGASMV